MTKADFLKVLEEGLKIEEEVIPIYTRHISNTLFLSGFPTESVAEIRATLNTLLKESEAHRQVYLEMIRRVQEAEQDVY